MVICQYRGLVNSQTNKGRICTGYTCKFPHQLQCMNVHIQLLNGNDRHIEHCVWLTFISSAFWEMQPWSTGFFKEATIKFFKARTLNDIRESSWTVDFLLWKVFSCVNRRQYLLYFALFCKSLWQASGSINIRVEKLSDIMLCFVLRYICILKIAFNVPPKLN